MSQYADEIDEDYYRDDLNDEDHEDFFYNRCASGRVLDDEEYDEFLDEEEDSLYDCLGD